MKTLKVIMHGLLLIGCTVAFLGCKQRPSASLDAEEPSPPKIEGEKIIFPEKSLQPEALAIATAGPPQARVANMTGRVFWDDDVTVRVFSPVSGRIEEIIANLGQRVSVGDALARVASPEFAQSQADARKAASDFKLAERALSRARELSDHGAFAQKDLEAAEADYNRALAEKERAAATLAVYGAECESSTPTCSLKARINGFVVEKSINPGQEVRADQVGADARPLFVISDPSKLWLSLDVMESDLSDVKAGQRIEVHSSAYPSRVFNGKIEIVGASIDPATRTVKVRATVENPDMLLKGEMYITAEVKLDSSNRAAAEVPARAVFFKENRQFVFIESSRCQYVRRCVKASDERNGKVFVMEGLTVGERVVTDGSLLLQALIDGSKS